MIRALVLALLAGCGSPSTPSPQTPAAMRAYRLTHADCRRSCPVGQEIAPVEPQAQHILDDCCTDPDGLSWTSCAWNREGRYLTLDQLLSQSLNGCGSPGFPECR